jgi:hypothetical protein
LPPAWYNGHPDHWGLEIDLQAKQVVVVGAGNLAVDVARVLAQSRVMNASEIVGAELDPLSEKALEDADKTRTRNVEIIGGTPPARPRTARVPLDRLHRRAATGRPLRLRSRPDPQRRRARAVQRRCDVAWRVRHRLDQARALGCHRDQQEGLARTR